MDMDAKWNEEKNGVAQMPVFGRSLPVELSREFVLPDYQSEIRKLLSVTPTALPPACFPGEERTEVSGTVRYDVLYVGPDGGLYAAQLTDEYAFSLPQGGNAEFSVSVTPEAVISRVTAPRKLSLRCRMRADAEGYGERRLTFAPADGEEVLQLYRPAECGRFFRGGTETVELTDAFLPEGEGEIRVISVTGRVAMGSADAVADGILCRGECVLDVLFCRGEENARPCALTRRLPFDAEIAAEGVTSDCRAFAEGTLCEVNASVEEGIKIVVSLGLSGEAVCDAPVLLTADLLAPGKSVACRMRTETLWRAGICENRAFRVSGESTRAECGLPNGAEVIFAVAEADGREHLPEPGHTVLSGTVHCRVFYRTGSEYGTAELTFPFRTVAEGDFPDVRDRYAVPCCRVTTDGERVRAEADVCCALRTSRKTETSCVESAEYAPLPAPAADMEICYPAAGDTLWSVAKRYGAEPAALAAANGISDEAPGEPESLSDVRFLRIV